MKRKAIVWLVLLALLMACGAACAEVAEDITEQCRYAQSSGVKKFRLYDDTYSKAFSTDKEMNPYIQIKMPEDKPCYGLYINWADATPPAWELQVYNAATDAWDPVSQGGTQPYANEYMPVPGAARIRIQATGEEKTKLRISELVILGEGELPDYIQQWEPTPEKADLLLLSAHPDDEYIFMGGTIPYYAGELKKDVVVCYMTHGNDMRRTELLNGLWEAGLRTYPVIGTFYDQYTGNLKKAYELWPKKQVQPFFIDVIQTYRPEVVVTHDVNGEYGHGAHRLCADLALDCLPMAAEGEKAWQVKKLYLHLYKENPMEMDWRQPLEAFDGKTALEVAADAFKHHKSQIGGSVKYRGKKYVFTVEDSGPFDNSRFGLAFSTVGEDVLKNDFFENIEE